MTRYIEIQNEKDIQLFNDEELPFSVSFIKEEKNKQYLKITRIDENLNEEIGAIKCAYIAEDEGHLFFQPDIVQAENNTLKIFHNDELVEKSVWIKSGDFIRIENKIISFKISGDRIDIRISDRAKITVLTPPPANELILKDSQTNSQHVLETVSDNENELTAISVKKDTRKINKLVFLLLIILTGMACFILFAETVTISIKPKADKIQLDGLLPAIKISERYIVLTGEYRLTVYKEGFKTIDKTLQVSSGNNTFTFSMEEKPGIVQFKIKPKSNNKLFIDDILLANNINEAGKSVKYEIEKGIHRLKIINPRYKDYEQNIKIEGKDNFQQFDIELEANWGTVEIDSIPDSALIEIKSKGNKNPVRNFYTPAEIELIAGQYELILRKEKYKTIKKNITLNADEILQLKGFEMQPEDALINISSNPLNSIIRIDGQYFGKTPLSVKISSLIEHEIEVSLAGYKSKKEFVKLQPEAVENISIELQAKYGVVYITSSPKEAKLYIDGKLQKKSSGKFNLNENYHTITVKAKGYKSQTKKLNASSYSKNISFLLEKKALQKTNSSKPLIKKSNSIPSVSIKKKNYTNSIGQKMIQVQADSFTMGSAKNEIGRRANEREHKVKITRAFYLSEKEISNRQYKQFKYSHNSGISLGKTLNGDNQPVVNISWNEAAKFANWLSTKEGLKPFYKEKNGKMVAVSLKGDGNGYRLPFEAEWSLAARGRNQQKYPWTGQYPPRTVSGNFADESARSQVSVVIDGYNDKNAVSAEIGSYIKNQFGFFDMGGNVSEWCQDYYVPYSGFSGSAFSKNTVAINPTGPENGIHRVVRDSSWKDSSITELRLSYRGYSKKSANDIGFRVARYAQ